jgi:hypothetical protein
LAKSEGVWLETSVVRDKFGQYHVKPCIDGEPSSNDGMIVTAYAKKVGLPTLIPWDMYTKIAKIDHLPIERTPGKSLPYPSRDFFLGTTAMGIIPEVMYTEWKYSPIKPPKFDLKQFLKELWMMTPDLMSKSDWAFQVTQREPGTPLKLLNWVLVFKHRNFFWRNGLTQLFRFVFVIPMSDRPFHIRMQLQEVPWIYRVREAIDKKIPTSNNSSKLIKYLKYDIDPGLQCFVEYFGAEHPITKAYQSLTV